jgi:CCR4-NOT transcription complex subunit 6
LLAKRWCPRPAANSNNPPAPTKPKRPPQAVVFDPEAPNQLKQEGEIRVLCYNVLAESYALPDRINYCPVWALQWEYRKHRLLKEITSYDPDIMCLQEVESEQFRTFFQPELASRGYSGVFRPKSRHRTMDDWRRVDGCATFYRKEMFSEIQDYTFEFQSIALQKHESIAANGDSGLNRFVVHHLLVLLRRACYGVGHVY